MRKLINIHTNKQHTNQKTEGALSLSVVSFWLLREKGNAHAIIPIEVADVFLFDDIPFVRRPAPAAIGRRGGRHAANNKERNLIAFYSSSLVVV